MTPLLILSLPCDEAVERLIDDLTAAGLQTITSFDSSYTRLETAVSPCPHHGSAKCDCQIIILLVYGGSEQPIALLAHGQDGKTWVAMATDEKRQRSTLEETIVRTITP